MAGWLSRNSRACPASLRRILSNPILRISRANGPSGFFFRFLQPAQVDDRVRELDDKIERQPLDDLGMRVLEFDPMQFFDHGLERGHLPVPEMLRPFYPFEPVDN